MSDLHEILTNARTVAVVGCSPRTGRPSHQIARYLVDSGYEVIPVNPFHTELLGFTCYPNVQDIPPEVTLDIVDIFRRPEFTEGVVQDVIERMKTSSDVPVIWTQFGVSSPSAAELAAAANLTYIPNKCILVEHRNLALG